MTLIYKDVLNSEITKANRFDAKYFFLQDEISHYYNNKNIQLVNLGDENLLKKITDGEHSGQTFVDSGITFIKNSSVKDFDISLYDNFYITEAKHKSLKRSALKEEDVLFTTIGHLGSSTIVPKGFPEANINQNLVKMEINADFISPYYIAAFLNSSFIRRQITCLLTGNIQSILTYPKIKQIKIIKANDSFQKSIEDLYKKAISENQNALQTIEDCKEYIRTALSLSKMKTYAENFYDVSFNNLKNSLWTPKYYYPKYVEIINYIKSNFNYDYISNLVDISNGDEVGSESYNTYLEKNVTDIPFIRTSDLYNYQFDRCPDFFVDKSTYKELNQNIEKNDILFTNDGKIGLIAMIVDDDPIIVQSHINILKLKSDKITIEYLYAMLMLDEINFYQCDKCTVIQSTIPTLANRINEFIIPILDEDSIKYITMKAKEANMHFRKNRAYIKEMQEKIETLLLESKENS